MKIHKHTIRIHRHNNKNTYITVLNRNTIICALIKNGTYRIYLQQLHIVYITSNSAGHLITKAITALQS